MADLSMQQLNLMWRVLNHIPDTTDVSLIALKGHLLVEEELTEFCVEALEEALSRYGRPELFNNRSRGTIHS